MRESAKSAEYMELANAVKDADCHKVEVPGGISQELGCCDYFQPKDQGVQEFECGECKHVNLTSEATGDSFNEPLSSDESSAPSFPAYKTKALTGSHALTPFKVKQARMTAAKTALAGAIGRSRRARQSGHKWGV